MTECICAIDQGTQSTRVLFFDKESHVLAKHQVELTQHHPQPGWIEHDALEIMRAIHECIEGALQTAREESLALRVAGVGITNQRQTTVAWDKHTGQPFHRAIVWCDNRTADTCSHFKRKLGSPDYFREVTGLPISSFFTSYKIHWLLANVPEMREAVADSRCLVGTIDTWLIWNLTGGHHRGVFVTDVSNAGATNMMELATGQWHQETLDTFGIKREMLAEIKSNAEVYGHISEGPLRGVPISGCVGDQNAALLGQRCSEGQAKNTYGTGCFLLLNTGHKPVQSRHGLITTVAFQLGKQAETEYALEGSIAVGGAGITWLKNTLGALEKPEDSEEIAGSVPDTAGVIFVPAFNGLLAPHWRDDARGLILGLSTYTKMAHIVRAMLEAITWQTKEVLEAMRDDYQAGEVGVLKADGGASQNNLLLQIQADHLQLPVRRPGMTETTCLGAAYAAGIGVGFWTAEEIFSTTSEGETVFEPEMSASDCNLRYGQWTDAVRRSFGASS